MKRILSIVMVLVMLLALCGCDKLDYNKAMKAYDNGDYAEARDLFSELGDYEDSAKMVKDCDYRIAKRAMKDENYEEALEAFEALEDYKESEELAMECRYILAIAQMEAGEYEPAAEALTELGDYEDAAQQLLECRYQLALKTMEAGEYEKAAEAFLEIVDYEDADQQLLECDYQLALKAIEDGNTDEAMEKLTALDDYKDSAELINGMLCDQLVGQWTAEFDATKFVKDTTIAAVGRDYVSGIEFGTTTVRFDMEISADHSVKAAADSDSLLGMVKDVESYTIAGLKVYYPKALQEMAEQYNTTVDVLYDEYGVETMDELIVVLLDGKTIEEFVDDAFDEDVLADVDDYTYSGTLYAEYGQVGISSSDYSIRSITYDAAADTIHISVSRNELGIDSLTFTRK